MRQKVLHAVLAVGLVAGGVGTTFRLVTGQCPLAFLCQSLHGGAAPSS